MSKVLKTIKGIETFEKLEDVYSYLRKDVKYKEKKIEIVYNQETKEYIIEIYNEKETNYDKEIDINVDMEVVYGDSVTGDTPLLLRKNNMIYIENIAKLFKENEKIDYPGFKMFDKEVRLEKEYSLSDYEIWSDGGWVKINKVIRHKCEKKIYRVLTRTGYVKVTEDHSLLNAKNEIVKPSECNLETELLTSYPKEFVNNIECSNELKVKGQLEAAKLYYNLKKKGFYISLQVLGDDTYEIKLTENRLESGKIKKISIDTNKYDYVYDIETENGHFQAGIGDIIVKNTDSIMIRMKYNRDDFIQNRKDSFKLGEECARILTDDIFNRKPIEMEAENIYNPFIMLTRKRYTAKKYEDPENVLKTKGIITKGLATTRRDYSPMIQKCLKSIIEEIMKTEGKPSMKQKVIKDSINIYLETLENIKNNKVPLIDIVTSATLKKTYKNENLPHVNLYKKLKDRKEEVQIGDRIQFVFIEDLTNTKPKNELAEDPKYVERNGLNINRYFYTEKLAKVILGFYKSILTQEQLNEILDITNRYIESYSGKCLKEKDFEVD